jgi:Ca-activated chloride channel homolog
MTAAGGRRSGRRVLSWVLAIVLLGAARPAAVRGVPVFCVLFGESSAEEMTEVATLTGGRMFDARATPLADVFQEIRGYV